MPERLREQCRAFLQTPLELLASHKRMGAALALVTLLCSLTAAGSWSLEQGGSRGLSLCFAGCVYAVRGSCFLNLTLVASSGPDVSSLRTWVRASPRTWSPFLPLFSSPFPPASAHTGVMSPELLLCSLPGTADCGCFENWASILQPLLLRNGAGRSELGPALQSGIPPYQHPPLTAAVQLLQLTKSPIF